MTSASSRGVSGCCVTQLSTWGASWRGSYKLWVLYCKVNEVLCALFWRRSHQWREKLHIDSGKVNAKKFRTSGHSIDRGVKQCSHHLQEDSLPLIDRHSV
ncbi:uncharacterized protein K489DRAFT_384676 [Dissoconium aciculare CBS 342.82]|uniref:Uncharacterized protein n=1 Tax=Dissoconium aciculare CBS 342.82 TaxID=1314786 RepID=A0A6J3LSL4_9PEZI|nr:uncharacterized protein K489DRAFT_384676 [Dissoconium aciculare CBS 342.82]KAF1818771.1 hypothetical protein K489DRAFT_384676 [Dissoconium aciculare CBS 342.82]